MLLNCFNLCNSTAREFCPTGITTRTLSTSNSKQKHIFSFCTNVRRIITLHKGHLTTRSTIIRCCCCTRTLREKLRERESSTWIESSNSLYLEKETTIVGREQQQRRTISITNMLCLDVDIQGLGIELAPISNLPDFDIDIDPNSGVWMLTELTSGICMRGAIAKLVWMASVYIGIGHLS